MNRVDSSLEGISANLRGEGCLSFVIPAFAGMTLQLNWRIWPLRGGRGPNKTVKFLESDAKKYSIGFLSFDNPPHWWLRKTSSFL